MKNVFSEQIICDMILFVTSWQEVLATFKQLNTSRELFKVTNGNDVFLVYNCNIIIIRKYLKR